MKFILGTKVGMTQVFRPDGTVVPVTKVQAGPCVVSQIKTVAKDGVNAVQIGFGEQKTFRLNKAEQGHRAGLSLGEKTASVRVLRDIRTDSDVHGLERGQMFTVKIFTPGEKVQVIGTSKGKGFQGVVKRHGFAGGPASHGHKDNLRMPGSIGAGGVQRVFKGMRMGGHMGDERVTVKNLEIVEIDPTENELLIKGAIPGARGSVVVISTQDGKIEVEQVAAPEVTETPVVEGESAEQQETVVESTETVNQ